MNKTDVVAKVSEKTGIATEICEKIIDAFEGQAGDALINKFKGVKSDHADVLEGITKKTGLDLADCEKVVASLEGVLGTGLSDKLKFFK